MSRMKRYTGIGRRAFTLSIYEVLVLIVIIGIFVTIALPHYTRMREKAVASEAINTLGALKDAELRYKLENGTYTTNHFYLGMAGVTFLIPAKKKDVGKKRLFKDDGDLAVPEDNWLYIIDSGSTDSFSITARKAKDPYHGETITLTWNDATGVGWSGTHPGVPTTGGNR